MGLQYGAELGLPEQARGSRAQAERVRDTVDDATKDMVAGAAFRYITAGSVLTVEAGTILTAVVEQGVC